MVVDWKSVYELLDQPMELGKDCGDYCRDRIFREQGDTSDMHEALGYIKPYCCHSRPTNMFVHDVVLLPTEAEWRYAMQYDDEERKDNNYPCAVLKDCPRKSRPFMCRTFPWYPFPDAYGNIEQIEKWGWGGKDTCPAPNVNEKWLFNWYKVWKHLLKHKGIRIWAYGAAISSREVRKRKSVLSTAGDRHAEYLCAQFRLKVEALVESHSVVDTIS